MDKKKSEMPYWCRNDCYSLPTLQQGQCRTESWCSSPDKHPENRRIKMQSRGTDNEVQDAKTPQQMMKERIKEEILNYSIKWSVKCTPGKWFVPQEMTAGSSSKWFAELMLKQTHTLHAENGEQLRTEWWSFSQYNQGVDLTKAALSWAPDTFSARSREEKEKKVSTELRCCSHLH